ncbi:amidase [Nocardia fluminea]
MVVFPFSWTEWQKLDALELACHIRDGQVEAKEVAQQAAAAIEAVDAELRAVLEVFPDAIDNPYSEIPNQDGPLVGVPMLIKDSGSAMRGRLREWGSRLSIGQRATADCPITLNLRDAGLNLIGRTALPEAGKTIDTSANYQGTVVVTRNPWNLSKTPGGSSGGSAAIVSAGAVPVARSGDAAGSTRVPASFTGLIGHKPTRGLLPPPGGTNELTNHRIQEGVLTRTIRDQAALLDVMIQGFPMAHYIAAKTPEVSYLDQIKRPPGTLRIAISVGSWGLPGACASAVADRVREVGLVLANELGHTVEMIDDEEICEWNVFWPSVETNWLTTAWFWRSMAERRGWPLERLSGELTPQNANLLEASGRLTVPDLRAAAAANPQLMASLARFFSQYDVLLSPTFPDPTPDANGAYSLLSEQPFSVWFPNLIHGMRYTVLGNEAGIPSLCLPSGLVDDMPVGSLLYGPPSSDGLLLQLGAQLESARPGWFGNVPPVSLASFSNPTI